MKWSVCALCFMIGFVVAHQAHVFLGKDNIVEQATEVLIESQLGVKCDLTPEI